MMLFPFGVFLLSCIFSALSALAGTVCFDVGIGQIVIAFAASFIGVVVSAVSNPVADVLAAAVPSQVFRSIVQRVVVGVENLHAGWTWADERL
jgi:hypothetical protein